MNALHFNRNLNVFETSSVRDGQARVNQFGIHNHAAGVKNNLIETAIDATTFMGPIGTIAHGANAIRHLASGNLGTALASAGKGLASLVPGLNLVVGGASMLKNSSDAAMHMGGWVEQQARFGGYENQTRLAQAMTYGNTMGGASLAFGANPYAMPRW